MNISNCDNSDLLQLDYIPIAATEANTTNSKKIIHLWHLSQWVLLVF